MKNATQKKIFISYRVQDTAGETGRLVDALKQHFADDQIFMDIENLEPGSDFTESIEKSLDTCDVFLAVIGPHWIGDRGSDTFRINDPNDWVRMEVSTALQRNIRVVPVLVDGGNLPKAEQLPPDLQPLLRRQAIEISNKRWRYDTDQLVQFLVNSVGIPPLNERLPSAADYQQPKKKKTWVYIAAGFALAFVVLIIIGLLLPEEGKVAGTDSGTEKNTQQQGGTTDNQNAALEQSGTQNNTVEENTGVNRDESDISGRWKEVDEGITSTFVLKQSGSNVTVQVELNGQVLSNGTGSIQNKKVDLNFLLFGIPTELKLTLSEDNHSLKGNYIVQATGDSQPIELVRQRN